MNIINFKDRRKKSKEIVDKDVIHSLELLLDSARKGEIISFAGVTLTNNNTMKNIYSGNIKDNYLSFQGMLNDLSVELKSHYEE